MLRENGMIDCSRLREVVVNSVVNNNASTKATGIAASGTVRPGTRKDTNCGLKQSKIIKPKKEVITQKETVNELPMKSFQAESLSYYKFYIASAIKKSKFPSEILHNIGNYSETEYTAMQGKQFLDPQLGIGVSKKKH